MADIEKIQPMGDSTQYNLKDIKAIRTYTRAEVGQAPNYDNPGFNGLFEIRGSSEVPDETGTRPYAGWYPCLTAKVEHVMLQIAGGGTSYYIRGKQAAGVTMADTAWNRIVLNNGTWDISITGNAATATALTSSAGSSTVPIYFSGGKPVQCSTTLGVSITGNAATATKISSTPNNTTTFLRGDNTWTNTLQSASGAWSYLRLHNGSYLWDIATHSDRNSSLEFRPNGGTLGVSMLTSGKMNITASSSGANDHVGMLDIVNNASLGGGCYYSAISAMCPSMGASQFLILIGQGRSSCNSGYMGFKYVGGGSASNALTFGLYGVDQRFNIYGNGQVLGACWNDYAEMRNVPGANEINQDLKVKYAGRCVYDVGDGTMQFTTKRLQRGSKIISDTYGFNIGEMENCKTPIAVSGRVLAFTDKNRDTFKPGYSVCSGKNGTISQMHWWEVILFPDRIVGTVSEIPTYKEWGQNKVPVNGRIWIYVK